MFVILSIGDSDDNDRPRAVPFSEFDLAIGGVLDSTWQRVTRAASVSQKVQRRSSTCGKEITSGKAPSRAQAVWSSYNHLSTRGGANAQRLVVRVNE